MSEYGQVSYYGDRDDLVSERELIDPESKYSTSQPVILEKYFDKKYQTAYYFNRETKESMWTLP